LHGLDATSGRKTEAALYAVLVPSEEMKRLHSELEDLVSELWHGPRFGVQRLGFRPRIDVMRTENPDELRVVVDLAGVEPADVQIAVHERALVIAGGRRRIHPKE